MNFRFFCSSIPRSVMQAIRIEKFGGPSVLKLQEVQKPTVTAKKVLVEIGSAGVNPVDTYIREGAFLNLPELPFTPGKDAAGIVRDVGTGVTKFKVGDRVFICGRKLGCFGAYAEFSLVDEVDTFPLPPHFSFDEGAAIGIPYFTAYRALVIKGQCRPGEFVLVHGASGAVGLAAVQLAKRLQLKVIGTAGTPEGIELVKGCGADFAVCHRDKGYMDHIMEITGDQGVDIVVEMLANVNLDKDLDVMRKKGRLVVVGSRGPTKVDPRKLMGPELQISGVALLNSDEAEWEQTSKYVLEAFNGGSIRPVIDKRYALCDAPTAHHDIIHCPGAKGKLILTVKENLS